VNLSPFLYELSEKITLPKVMILVEHCGGVGLYVPKSAGPHQKLTKLLGQKAAQILADNYGGQTIIIALNATGDHAQHHAKRRERIRELREQGKSHSQIARELRTTDRTVRKTLGEEKDDRQQGLF
jgi:DNA-binding NarL/FixJ family response regulator